MQHAINKYIAILTFLLAITGSLISQTPFLLESGYDQIFKLIWVLPFCYMFFTAPQTYLSNKLLPFYLFVLVFALYCFTCQMFTGRQYLNEDLYNIAISLMMTMVSYNIWLHHGSQRVMQAITFIMLIGGLCLSVVIYISFLSTADITSNTYAYGEKNSIAQILLCCGYLSLIFITPSNKLLRWSCWLIVLIIFIVMAMNRSRATLLSACYIIYYYVFHSNNKKLKVWIIMLSLLSIGYLTISSNAYELIMNGIILGGRDATDINSLSSNRVILFAIALQRIPQHPWLGSGDYYVDCMPLNILTQYGIWGLIIVLIFLYYIFKTLSKLKRTDPTSTIAYIVFMAFIVNALFEARPPFGPGVKCFFVWLLIGISFAISQRQTPDKHYLSN